MCVSDSCAVCMAERWSWLLRLRRVLCGVCRSDCVRLLVSADVVCILLLVTVTGRGWTVVVPIVRSWVWYGIHAA